MSKPASTGSSSSAAAAAAAAQSAYVNIGERAYIEGNQQWTAKSRAVPAESPRSKQVRERQEEELVEDILQCLEDYRPIPREVSLSFMVELLNEEWQQEDS